MCTDMCTDMCIEMCVHMCMDVFMGMCMDLPYLILVVALAQDSDGNVVLALSSIGPGLGWECSVGPQ